MKALDPPLPPGSELDRAVAEALGAKIMALDFTAGAPYYWAQWPDGQVHPIPSYSTPRTATDKAALMDLLFWARARGIVMVRLPHTIEELGYRLSVYVVSMPRAGAA